jgi:hypothetical protein
VRLVTLAQLAPQALALRLVVRVLRVTLVRLVTLAQLAPQARALHRVMLGRSMLADQVMQARQLQPTVQMQLKSGHSNRYQ